MDAPTLLVRAATPADAEAIAAFNAAIARESEHRELDPARLRAGVQQALADPARARYFLACLGERIIGQLMLTVEWSDWRNGWFWWIQSVYVDREQRGRGVYAALHRHVRQLARAGRDVIGLRLYVERGNARARRVYDRLGMHPTSYLVYEEDWSGDAER
jgi:GNAT superfamily N-acetyltransferase